MSKTDADRSEAQLSNGLIEEQQESVGAKTEKDEQILLGLAQLDNEEHFRAVVETACDAIVSIDGHGNIVFWNSTAETMFGFPADEAIGRTLDFIIPEQFQHAHQTGIERVVSTGKTRLIGKTAEVIALKKDGSKFPIELSLALWRVDGRPYFTGIIRDISDRVAMEKQLVQSETMAALGGMVAGVAHEINTPVGIALMSASHLKEKSYELKRLFSDGKLTKSSLSEYIDSATELSGMIQSNLDRAATLVKSFKMVAVDQMSEVKQSFNLKQYLNDLLVTLHPRLKKTRHTVVISGPDDLQIHSYPGAFSQVFSNLITNSLVHAYAEDDAGNITIEFSPHGDNVEIVYLDDGKGILDEHLDKIFEPFFTTSRGEGSSGLGLHIIHNLIVKVLNGTIKVESRSQEWTRFILQIPVDVDN